MSEDIIKDLSNMDVSDDQWVYECAQKAIHEIDRLRAKNARLREALECLIDEQNGPPLEARAHSWQMAIDRACAALAEEEKEP